MWTPSVAVPTNTPQYTWDVVLRHKHPSSSPTPHMLERKRAAVWGAGCLGTGSSSCENRQWCQSSKGLWVARPLWSILDFIAALREGGGSEVEYSICVSDTESLHVSGERATEKCGRWRKLFPCRLSALRLTAWPPDRARELQVQSYNPSSFSLRRAAGARCQQTG